MTDIRYPNRLRLVVPIACVFLLSWFAGAFHLDQRRAESTRALLAQISATQEVAWQAANVMHENSVRTYVDEYILQPRTLELLRMAQDPEQRDIARILLYRHLHAVYVRLRAQGLRQLQFHLPNNDSLLRFNRPVRFGDNLTEIRPSIAFANRELRPSFAFEVGRVISGFRSVFPILDHDGDHLGSVELSVPFGVIREEMSRLLPQREFEMLLRADVVGQTLFDEQTRLYGKWPGSDRFVIEDPDHLLPDAPPELSDAAAQLVARFAVDADARAALASGRSGAVTLRVADEHFTIALTTITGLLGEPVGFIASYAPEPGLVPINHAFLSTLVLATVLLLLLAATSYVLLQQNALKLFERQRLQAINETLGEGLYMMDDRGVISHINRRACELLGYTEGELLGRVAHDVFHCHHGNDHLPLAQCPIFISVTRGEEYSAREVFRRKDEQLFFARVTSRPIVQHDVFSGSVTSFADISDQVAMQDALRDSEARYRSVVEGVREVIFQTDLQGKYTFLNSAWTEITGFAIADSLGNGFLSQVHPDDREYLLALFRKVIRRETEHCRHEARFLCMDGGFRWIECYARLREGPKGEAVGISGTLHDISERKQADARLQLAASVFSHAREGIAITDAAGSIVEVNDAFCRITGYMREEVLGQNPRMLHSGRQSPTFYDAMWKTLIEQDYWSGEIWNRRKNGEVYAELLTISAMRDDVGTTQHYVALFTDITPLKKHQQRLEFLAHYDALTGLPNRVLMGDRLQQAMVRSRRQSKPLAVVYLDLDGFKVVNDTYGHDVGDELLIHVTQRLQSALREGDTLARFGGDEFVAVLPDLERAEDCDAVLERMLRAAADPVTLRGHGLRVSASIGATIYPEDDAAADQLMRHADQAMYQAKQAGKNRFHYFDTAQEFSARNRSESVERIRRALQAGEFVLHYQPKVNMRTGGLIGAEALIRWQHPELGLLPPAEFLPLIENHPLSEAVDDWVMDTTLAQIASWHEQGLLIAVSANISARMLQTTDFVERLSARIARYPELPPHCLELEVIETSAFEDVARASDVMHACSKLGVRFALDDFGTGYSSLTYLRRLPVHILKIDQSFVRDMLDDPDDLVIVDGVVGLAAAFRRGVIAEGVETVEHGELLLPLGCELGQGYGIARAMPAADLPGWAASWRPDPRWTAWLKREFRRNDLPILFAQVEHRAWVRDLERCLNSNSIAPPPMDVHQCRFAIWLDGKACASHGLEQAYHALLPLHRRVHELGAAILALRDQSRNEEARATLAELHTAQEALIEQLRVLSWVGQ